MSEFAVRYTQPLLGAANAAGYLIAMPGVSVLIRQDGVACDVFADNVKTPMDNPIPTGVPPDTAGVDTTGNLTIYLEPGRNYSGVATVGASSTTFAIPDINLDALEPIPVDAVEAIVGELDLATEAALAAGLATKATPAQITAAVEALEAELPGTYVPATGDATVDDLKTFTTAPVLPAGVFPMALLYDSNKIENAIFNDDLSSWLETGADANHTSARVGGQADTDLPTIGFTPTDRGWSGLEMVATVATATHNRRSTIFPLDPTKAHVMRCWAKKMSGTAAVYVGVIPISETGAELSPKQFLLGEVNVPSSWTHYDITVAANVWPAGTKYGRLEIWGLYSSIGVVRFSDFSFFPEENSVVPGATIGTYTGGHEMYRAPDGFVWVASHYGLNVSKFNPTTRARVASVDLPGSGYLHDIHGDGTHAWVVDVGTAPNDLYKVRLSDCTVVGQFTVPGPSTVHYGVRCFGGYVWLGGGNGAANSRLVRFDPVAETFTNFDIGLDVTSNNVGIADDGTHLYVTSQATNEVIKVTTAGVVAARYALTFSPYGIGCDGTHVYVGTTSFLPSGPGPTQRSTIARIRISTGVIERHTLKWGVESNWKYDGTRFVYGVGSVSVGGPTSFAIVRWDNQTGAIETAEFPLLRHKACEVVGSELWAVGYHYPELRVFRR